MEYNDITIPTNISEVIIGSENMEMKAGMEKNDQNENFQSDLIDYDANANIKDGNYIDCDIRETKSDLENSNKTSISSEVLSAMAKAAAQDKWIEYNGEKEDLTSWLENNKPSMILRFSLCFYSKEPPEHLGGASKRLGVSDLQ